MKKDVGIIPPWSNEVEKLVLSCAMLGLDWADQVVSETNDESYFKIANQIIFKAIKSLVSQNKIPDIVMVSEELRSTAMLERIGGPAYLSEITEMATVVDLAPYIEKLRGYAVRRRVIKNSMELKSLAFDDEVDPIALINDVQDKAFSIADIHSTKMVVHIRDVLPEAFKEAESYVTANTREMKTGIESLDKQTGGLHRKEVVVIAGRPGHGKTALAECIAANVAKNHGTVLFFTQEMSSTQLALRALCRNSGVSLHRLRTGKVSKEEYAKLSEVAGGVSDLSLYLDETASVTPMDVITKARKLKREKPDLCLVIIDYLTLMDSGRDFGPDAKRHEIESIVQALRTGAKELDVCMMEISQLSRNVESGKDKHPHLQHLKEASGVEEAAHEVIMVYRPELYYPKKDEYKNIAELGIEKQRNGPLGWITVSYNKALMRFAELTQEDDTSAWGGGE